MNAFVASYDVSSHVVSFRMEPVIDGQIEIDDGLFTSLSDLQKDLYGPDIAVADGDSEMEDGYLAADDPSLREELTGILMRRFESTREAIARTNHAFEKSGCGTFKEYIDKRPAHVVTLRDLERGKWDSREYKDITINFFTKHGVLPEFDEDGKAIQPANSTLSAVADAIGDTYPQPMGADAFYGVAGDFVRLVKPETEADPVALLGNFLIAAGLLFSRNAFVVADGKRHHAVEYLLMAGDSGVGRKGTATNRVIPLMDNVSMFYQSRVLSGLSTGEGLVRALTPKGEDQDSVRWFLAIIQEFASLLSVMKREGNTMSAILREAYDGGKLRVLTRKDPLTVDNVNLGVIAHITNEELLNNLTDTDRVNGFANRFLTICVKRWQLLPEGGEDVNAEEIIARLKDAVEKSKGRGRIARDDEAKKLWKKHYSLLTRKRVGLRGALLSRAETHVLRLSLIYALLDGADAIRVEHLKAALAFWTYVENSVGHIYRNASGDTAADKMIAAMSDGPITKTEIRRIFNDNKPTDWVDAKIQSLISQGLIVKSTKQTGNGIRESWGLRP